MIGVCTPLSSVTSRSYADVDGGSGLALQPSLNLSPTGLPAVDVSQMLRRALFTLALAVNNALLAVA